MALRDLRTPSSSPPTITIRLPLPKSNIYETSIFTFAFVSSFSRLFRDKSDFNFPISIFGEFVNEYLQGFVVCEADSRLLVEADAFLWNVLRISNKIDFWHRRYR